MVDAFDVAASAAADGAKHTQKCRMLLAILCPISKARTATMVAVHVVVSTRGGVFANFMMLLITMLSTVMLVLLMLQMDKLLLLLMLDGTILV